MIANSPKTIALWLSVLLLTLMACRGAEKSNPKVIGGTSTPNPGFFVTLHDKFDSYGRLASCGGSLIEDSVVLTAAHCVNSITHAVKFSEGSDSQMIEIFAKTIHEDFDGKIAPENDIALLFLDPSSMAKAKQNAPDLMTKIKPVSLDTNNWWTLGESAKVTVYGEGSMTSIGKMTPEGIRAVQLEVVSKSKCNKSLGQYATGLTLADHQICTMTQAGGTDACKGDSGGPLVTFSKTGKPSLAGVTSFGVGCAQPNQAGVFTRVASHVHWIKSKIAAFNDRLPYSSEDFKNRPKLFFSPEVTNYLKRKLGVMCFGIGKEQNELAFRYSEDQPFTTITKIDEINFNQPTLIKQSTIKRETITGHPVCKFEDSTLGLVKVRAVSGYDPYDDYQDPYVKKDYVITASQFPEVLNVEFKKTESKRYECQTQTFGLIKLTKKGNGYFLATNLSYNYFTADKNPFSGFLTRTDDLCDSLADEFKFEVSKSKQGFDYIKSIIVINPYGLRFRYNRVEKKSLSTNLEVGLELNSDESSSKLTIDNPSESTLFGILVSCSMPFQLRFAGDTIGSNPSFKVGKGTDVPSKYERQGLHYVALDSAIYPTSKIAPGKSLTIPLNFQQLDQSQNDLKCYVNHIFSAKIQG